MMLYYIFFLFCLISPCYMAMNEYANDNQPQVFIVRVENELMPSSFSDIDEWYKSILHTVTLRSNQPKGGHNANVIHIYENIFNGFSAQLTIKQAELLQTQPEVIKVFSDQIYQLHTTRTPHFMGLNSYDNPTGLLKDSNLGSDVVIGVLDTGIWPESPSFRDEGLGPIPAHFKGKCEGGKDFPSTLCNNKLVGVRYYTEGLRAMVGMMGHTNGNGYSARDDQAGHGTHTASTMAGRSLPSNTSFFGYAKGEANGVAPKARLAIYKVCWAGKGCSGSDILAAYDQAVQDGVNIISMSLGGLADQYANDLIAIGSFGAVEKGVFVSASAGNYGPAPGSVTNIAPWLTTVGASTIDRAFPAVLILGDGERLSGTSLYTGKPLRKKKYFPLAYGSNTTSIDYCSSPNPNLVKGKIVICYAGKHSEVMKGYLVKRAGGAGIVLVNLESNGEAVTSHPHLIPGLSIPSSATKKLTEYYTTAKNPNATIVFHGTELDTHPAPAVAAFSGRGPNLISHHILKPDIIAPGLDILAAWPETISPSGLSSDMDPRKTHFNIISGTSMSCPHVSGIAALLKGAHPDWSPAMIRSAMMTTAYKDANDGKPIADQETYEDASVWDTGSGHVDPEKANDPGLVYDITVEDYIDFLCASKINETDIKIIVRKSVCCKKRTGNVWDLNYPAIVVALEPPVGSRKAAKVVAKRTLTNVGVGPVSYMARVVNPRGVKVRIDPPMLSFKRQGVKKGFRVSFEVDKEYVERIVGDEVGWLIWSDEGKHNVTTPLIVSLA